MAKEQGAEIVVGLDIGTTKVCVVVGQRTTDGVDIIGVGSAPCAGLREGLVLDLEATVASIRRAVGEAESMASTRIAEVYASVSGRHVRGFGSRAIVRLDAKEVGPADVARAGQMARTIELPVDRQAIHVTPPDLTVHDKDGPKPLPRWKGRGLEAKVHICCGDSASTLNLSLCVKYAGLTLLGLVPSSLASSEAVLTQQEKDVGVCVVDLGGGTADIAIFHGGSVARSAVVALGGSNFTEDLAVELGVTEAEAERIKREYPRIGLEIDVQSMPTGPAGRRSTRRTLADIFQARGEEIFESVRHEVQLHGFSAALEAGVVLTGGASVLHGTVRLARDLMGMRVRSGKVGSFGGEMGLVQSPACATGAGLVAYGARHPGPYPGAVPRPAGWPRRSMAGPRGRHLYR